jgi:hypothetical protein
MVVGGYIRGLGAKTRWQQGIRVVVFARAGKLLPLVALLLLEDRCLIDLLDGPCCCYRPPGRTLPPLLLHCASDDAGMVKPSHLYPCSSSSGGRLVALRDGPGRRRAPRGTHGPSSPSMD